VFFVAAPSAPIMVTVGRLVIFAVVSYLDLSNSRRTFGGAIFAWWWKMGGKGLFREQGHKAYLLPNPLSNLLLFHAFKL
jgi:hypothetical protein